MEGLTHICSENSRSTPCMGKPQGSHNMYYYRDQERSLTDEIRMYAATILVSQPHASTTVVILPANRGPSRSGQLGLMGVILNPLIISSFVRSISLIRAHAGVSRGIPQLGNRQPGTKLGFFWKGGMDGDGRIGSFLLLVFLFSIRNLFWRLGVGYASYGQLPRFDSQQYEKRGVRSGILQESMCVNVPFM